MSVVASQATDAVVLAAVALGIVLAVTGLASFDPRIRTRLPVAALARADWRLSAGFLLVGLALLGIAIG